MKRLFAVVACLLVGSVALAQLPYNGDFELGVDVAWYVNNPGSAQAYEETSVVHSGLKSVRLRFKGSTSATNAGLRSDNFEVVPSQPYTLSGWVRESVSNKDAAIVIEWLDWEQNFLSSNQVTTNSNGSWVSLSTMVTAPTVALYARILLCPNGGTGGLGEFTEDFYFDDILLEKPTPSRVSSWRMYE